MPPRSKALAAAIESIASSAPRRSSRRSISTSLPAQQRAVVSSSSSCSKSRSSTVSAPKSKRQRIGPNPYLDPADSSSVARGPRAEIALVKEEIVENSLTGRKPVAVKKQRTQKEAEGQDEIFPLRPSPHHPLESGLSQNGDRRGTGLFIGAHISSAGGVENAPLNALRIGGNAFSCFVRPKMQWSSNPIPDTSAEHFKQRVLQHSFVPSATPVKTEQGIKEETKPQQVGEYGYVVPHGCYLVNLANPDPGKREKSFEAFIDDLQRCEQLGIRLFNFHPGSITAALSKGKEPPDTGQISKVRAAKAEACALVASYINRAHALTSSVVILIENMAGSKNDTVLGTSLHDLAAVISRVTDKSRVGVCIDTCHAFAAGYDFTAPSSYASFVSLIDTTIGWETVRAFHLNDSKFPLGCKRDRHANIGRGHIGLGGFWSVVNDPKWNGIPLILETPALGNATAVYPAKEGTRRMHQVWSYQIQALYALRGTKWGEWKEAESLLQEADRLVAEADKLHAEKKASRIPSSLKKGKAKTKKNQSNADEEESDLSSEE